MKIILDGKTTLTKLPEILEGILNEVRDRTGLGEAPVNIVGAEMLFAFNVGEEPQYVTVTHDDVAELFTVAVKLDENGDIEKAVNNEEESFLDEYTRAVAKGETKEYSVIESAFVDEELEEIKVNDGGDILEVIYKHLPTGDTVVRYIKSDKLVGEFAFETAPYNILG